MKKNITLFSITLVVALGLVSLSFNSNHLAIEQNGIKITELKGSPRFSDAGLQLISPSNTAIIAAKYTFNFAVSNFTLGAQTPDADKKMCANSSKGQHVHFILDNAPYVASYSPQIEADIKPGHHVLLAFLSRSYHESLKHKSAYIIKEFKVGNNVIDNFDENAPHLFFSRPKGEYIGEKETQKVMLDFYLINCKLSAKGYTVRATINGNTFTITKWVPYIIEGLPLGEVKIKLELLDKAGKLVVSPFNGVERIATLKIEPAAK